MAEYIEKGALQASLLRKKRGVANGRYTEGWNDCLMRIKSIVSCFPAADVAPVVRAEWVNPHWRNSDYCYDCSNCGGEAMHRVYRWRDEKIYPICPNCGAKMDGGANNG